ncbi:hypothetical protein BS78_02G116800 [Paspalum vaginatum]|nr:hypothetical protein BS78_02G116800 [Paspalum vaginatum]
MRVVQCHVFILVARMLLTKRTLPFLLTVTCPCTNCTCKLQREPESVPCGSFLQVQVNFSAPEVFFSLCLLQCSSIDIVPILNTILPQMEFLSKSLVSILCLVCTILLASLD